MLCPFCKSDNIKVVNTRKFDTCNIRLRICLACHMGWHTEELIQITQIDRMIENHIGIIKPNTTAS